MKALYIIMTYFALGIISSCCSRVEHPYFEFESIQIEHYDWNVDNLNVGSHFRLRLTDLEFMAQNNYSFFNSAFAFQPCPSVGHRGLKNFIKKIDVSVNQIYFDTIPKGSNLNHLIKVGFNSEEDKNLLNDQDMTDIFEYGYHDEVNPYLKSLFIPKNELDTIHVFKFEIYQENGNKTTAFSNDVYWN